MGRARRVPVDPPLSWIKPAIRQSDINNSRMPSKTILRVAPWIPAGLAVGMSRFRSGVVAAVVGRGPERKVLDVLYKLRQQSRRRRTCESTDLLYNSGLV